MKTLSFSLIFLCSLLLFAGAGRSGGVAMGQEQKMCVFFGKMPGCTYKSCVQACRRQFGPNSLGFCEDPGCDCAHPC